jgi:hypothetical protein
LLLLFLPLSLCFPETLQASAPQEDFVPGFGGEDEPTGFGDDTA